LNMRIISFFAAVGIVSASQTAVVRPHVEHNPPATVAVFKSLINNAQTIDELRKIQLWFFSNNAHLGDEEMEALLDSVDIFTLLHHKVQELIDQERQKELERDQALLSAAQMFEEKESIAQERQQEFERDQALHSAARMFEEAENHF
jgi:hypothetical protein